MSPEQATTLQDEQAKVRKQLRELLSGVAAEKRGLTADERGQADRMTRQIEASEAELLDHDRYHAEPIDWPGSTEGAPPPAAVLKQRASGPGAPGRRYRDLFGAPKAGPYAKPEDYFRAIHMATTTGAYDPHLAMLAAMNEAVGSQGGFAVPEPLAASWLDGGLESETVRPRATVYPMTADTLLIPGWDDYDHSGGSIAGFKAYWTPELGEQTVSEGKLRRIELKAKKLLLATQLSNELLADGGQTFTNQLETKMAEAVSWTLDDRFINGNGVGQPLGLLADPALITVSKEGSQPNDTFVLENALKMYERMYPGGYANAVWIINHSVIPQLYLLVLKVKNVAGTENVGGSAVPYFTVGADGQMQLLGLPIVVTEKSPALGDKGDVILADLSQYAIGLRQDVVLESSRHAGWSTDSTFYRAVLRVEGMGTWRAVLTPRAGSTRSWVVTLEVR